MVYLNLCSLNKVDSIDFYSKKLGLFEVVGELLICNVSVDLIIDLKVVSEDLLSPQNFWILVSNPFMNALLVKLEPLDIEYNETNNLGGHHLSFTDPAGNTFGIRTQY